MRVRDRRSRFQRAIDPIKGMDAVHPPKAVKSGLSAIGGAVAVTAGSAAVSSLRRRKESRNHS